MIYPILLTVSSSMIYHLLLKHMSKTSPFLILFWSYLLASVVCLVVVLKKNENVQVFSVFQDKAWVPMLLGIALLGIELGYLWSYKSGGKVGQVSMISQMVSMLLMIAIGFVVSREPLTMQKAFGIASALFSFHLLR